MHSFLFMYSRACPNWICTGPTFALVMWLWTCTSTYTALYQLNKRQLCSLRQTQTNTDGIYCFTHTLASKEVTYKQPQHTCKHRMCHYKNNVSNCGSLGGNNTGNIPARQNKFPACFWKGKAAKGNENGLFVVRENCLWKIGGYWQAVTANMWMAATKKNTNTSLGRVLCLALQTPDWKWKLKFITGQRTFVDKNFVEFYHYKEINSKSFQDKCSKTVEPDQILVELPWEGEKQRARIS